MARRAKTEELPETDRLEGQPHPRESFALVGQDAALGRIARAIRAGRAPQGLLLSGQPGIGKATLGYRIARYLLRYGATDQGPADLAVSANDPVSMQVAAGAHPGLLLLKRGPNPDTGKLMTVLSVHEVRKLAGFFGLTSGAGGWRVAIVDTADDMNDAAANALLKALEEPPTRAMLILLANAPGRLLPTIRSRCQRFELRPLDEETLAREIERRVPDLSPPERRSLARLAGGSLGAALALASEDGLVLAGEADTLIERAAAPDIAATLALAEKLARMTDGVDRFGQFLIQVLTERIYARALSGAPRLERWTAVLETLKRSFLRTDALHLEPRQTILSAARAIAGAARGRAL
ncbi:MAG: DNA polymerase III subunit delta' [Rhizomicrobium sp.]